MNNTVQIDVRFFAGAAHAFGTKQASIELREGATLGDLVSALEGGAIESAGADASQVLARCSFLVDAVAAGDRSVPLVGGVGASEQGAGAQVGGVGASEQGAGAQVGGVVRVDVLPPFAGG